MISDNYGMRRNSKLLFALDAFDFPERGFFRTPASLTFLATEDEPD